MAGTPKPVAVVSCHVERILDDRVWEAYRTLVGGRPGGFAVASLVRPPDESRGEDAEVWLERVRELAGPLGHHTHWTAPDHARPLAGAETAARVLREGAWLRDHGLVATCFCGGGWYSDASVASACAALGYVDCTPRAQRPPRLASGGTWLELAEPAVVDTAAGRLLAIPTTHSLGELARLAIGPRRIPGAVVHAYFHDTDLLDRRRRRALLTSLALLRIRRMPSDLDSLAGELGARAPIVPLDRIVRGGSAGFPE